MSAMLIQYVGFKGMLAGVAALTFMYAPLLLILRNPTSKEEKQVRNCKLMETQTRAKDGKNNFSCEIVDTRSAKRKILIKTLRKAIFSLFFRPVGM